MWDDELMVFETIELVPKEQPNQQQPPQPDQPDQPVDFDDYNPDQPPDDFSPPSSPSGSAGSPPSPDSRDDSWRASDSSSSPPSGPNTEYVPSTTPPSSSTDSSDKAATGTSQDPRDVPTPPRPERELTLPPEFRRPNKTLLLKPAVTVALPSASAGPPPPSKKDDNYIYADVVVIPHNFGDTSDLPKATSPKPIFNPNPFGSLFSRSSRSKTTLPSSVLNNYPTERKSKR